jgi:GntR family transcriptional regulator/MocR family aminotransferase
MHRRYRARRDALVAALRRHLASEVEIAGEEAGVHLMVGFRRLPAERVDELVATCRARGVGVYSPRSALAVYSEHLAPGASLLLGYGLVDVDGIDRGVRILAEAYAGLMSSPHAGSTRNRHRARPANAARNNAGRRKRNRPH